MVTILPNHTVTIGNDGFYAQKCASDQLVSAKVYDDVEIQFGLPRSYGDSQAPRKFSFQSTEIDPDYMEITAKVARCNGILQFSSIFIGTFLAKITCTASWADGTDDVTVLTFTVEERSG